MPDFIHTKEAAKLVGRSEVTLKRLLKHIEQSSDKSETSRLIFKKVKVNNGYSWLIEKQSLFEHFNETLNKPIKEYSLTDHEQVNDTSKDLLIDTMKEQIADLRGQLEKMHFQLEAKDQQINRLHVLLQQATATKQIEHQPDKKPGVFSRALMKFGL